MKRYSSGQVLFSNSCDGTCVATSCGRQNKKACSMLNNLGVVRFDGEQNLHCCPLVYPVYKTQMDLVA